MKQLYAFHAVCNFFPKGRIVLSALAFAASITIPLSTYAQCSNVTNGGQVSADQAGCNGFDPSTFANITSPSGGSGALEISWMYKSTSTSGVFQAIPGANSLTYDPGRLWETTTFRRFARRAGCATYDGESNDITITITGLCGTPYEICDITGYDVGAERVFYIPNYGTDLRPVAGQGLHFAKYSNGEGHLYGQVERIANTNKKFDVDIWFYMASNYSQWLTMSVGAHSPNLGDESTWTYYLFNPFKVSTLIGQGTWVGTTLYVHDDPSSSFGLQLGDGANALNTNAKGFSTWFDYSGTMSGDGDMNGTYNCSQPCAGSCGMDSTIPNAVGLVPEVTIECGSTFPVISFTDNCSAATIQSYDETVISSLPCSVTYLREWVVSDDCGNHATFSQTLHVADTQLPVFTSVPADTMIECGDAIPATVVTAIDACDANVDIVLHQVIGTGCPYSITNTWRAIDNCGNASTATQVILVVDNTDPVISGVPADATLQCDDPMDAPAIIATDNCDSQVELTYSESISGGCPYTITRTWTAMDNCGNVSTASQLLTIVDDVAPIIYDAPADMVLECGDAIPETSVFTIDNCDENAILSLDAHTVALDCGENFVRTWTAVDACGNTSTVTQVITLTDSTAPSFTDMPADAEVACGSIPEVADVTANDDCSAASISFTEESSQAECPYTITRTWTATDACGNTSVATQVITVADNIDPVLTYAPAIELTLECDHIVIGEEPVFTDNCDEDLNVEFFEGLSNETGCGYDLERSWVATDNCGNNTVFSQIAHVTDTTPPVLVDVPAEAFEECGAVAGAVIVTATDNCDSFVEVTLSENILEAPCGYTITRNWIATDNCGNSSSASQIVHVADTGSPILVNVPADMSASCDAIPSPALVSATDNCDADVAVVFSEESSGESCDYLLIRTWVAMDDCGNSVIATQTITVHDGQAPVAISSPENATYQCDEVIDETDPVFTDNCDTDLIVISESDTELNGCNYTLHKSWTAMDNCGNATTIHQDIVIVDSTAPVFDSIPADMVITCDEIPAIAEPSVSDNCDLEVSLSYTEDVTGNCPFTITRTWTASDDCGNNATTVQTILVIDETAPEIEAVADTEVECGQVPDPITPIVTDNCDASVDIVLDEQSIQVDACTTHILRTWTATDNCGNTSTTQQLIVVIDSTPPMLIGVPDDTSIECGSPMPDVAIIALDACDENPVISLDAHTEMVGCTSYFTRTWTATDACGNSSMATQVVTITDGTSPLLMNLPSDMSISCNDPLPEASGDVYATDNCASDVVVSFQDELVVSECGSQLNRTFYADDNCGNHAYYVQQILIVDETSPEIFNIPSDITLECGQELPAISTAVTAIDNCDANVVISVTEISEGEGCSHHIKRFYTATDNCGNSTSIPQIITVVDQTLPVFNNIPEDITVACDNVPDPSELSAADNCDANVMIVFSEVHLSDDCPYQISRTWTASDNCGNVQTINQLLTVVDSVLPIFDPYPAFASVECDDLAEYTISASDNCDADVEVTIIQELELSGECYGSIERTYQATDNCGNSILTTQVIDIIDITAPVLHGVPEDVSLQCNETLPPFVDVTATDNCATRVSVSFREFATGEFCPYDVVRIWSAEDACGNVATSAQTIHVLYEDVPVVFFNAFPNPVSSGQLRIQFSVPHDAQARGSVCDMTGRCVMPLIQGQAIGGTLYQWFLDTEAVGPGTYTISMTVGDKVYNERVMVLNQ